jgi:hypothetical protein
VTEDKWETYRGYTFRLEKWNGEWWAYVRWPDEKPIIWTRLFGGQQVFHNFASIFRRLTTRRVKRWIDKQYAPGVATKRWPE